MGLNSTEIKILVDEFVSGKDRANSEEEDAFINYILSSKQYEDLVKI